MRTRSSGLMPGGGADDGIVIVNPFWYVQRLAERVRQLGPRALKEGMVVRTRVACVAPSHANGPEATGGTTRAAIITSVSKEAIVDIVITIVKTRVIKFWMSGRKGAVRRR